MEPEAQQIIAANLHRNFIDHAEYPRTAEIEQRCIRMLADLFHAPGETTGARTQGSSEAIMLGGLSLKWNWRKRREADGRVDRRARTWCSAVTSTSSGRSSAATSTSSHGSCRSRRASTRSVPMTWRPISTRTPSVSRPCSERRSPATRTTSSASTTCCSGSRASAASTSRCTWTVPAAALSGRSSIPTPPWDFRLEQVRSINVSGHKFGLVYPGIGWLIFREKADLASDLVFEENYLGKTDSTFTLNFSTGSAMVLAQYYNFVRYGRAGYTYIMKNMQANAAVLAEKLAAMGQFEIIGPDEEQLPLVAFRLAADNGYDEFDIAWQLSAERGWMVPAYTLPPNAQDVTIMRALVKETMSREHVDTLARDIEEACATLAKKGGAHESERDKIVTGPGH